MNLVLADMALKCGIRVRPLEKVYPTHIRTAFVRLSELFHFVRTGRHMLPVDQFLVTIFTDLFQFPARSYIGPISVYHSICAFIACLGRSFFPFGAVKLCNARGGGCRFFDGLVVVLAEWTENAAFIAIRIRGDRHVAFFLWLDACAGRDRRRLCWAVQEVFGGSHREQRM